MASLFSEFCGAVEVFEVAVDEPISDMKEGELALGVCPEELRPLFLARETAFLKLEAFKENLRARVRDEFGGDASKISESEIATISQAHTRLRKMSELASACFWRSLEAAFPDFADAPLGIRKGWQVVQRPSSERPGIVIMMRGCPFGAGAKDDDPDETEEAGE